jgi:hypothetical protein
LLLASEIGLGGDDAQNSAAAHDGRIADGVSGSGSAGFSSADELWLRVRQPLADRNYSTNAICTLSDGVEQWAAALAQHTQTSRMVLAVAPAPTLQLALAVAFGGNDSSRSDTTITRAGANGSATTETSWLDVLPGCVLLGKNGAVKETGERQQATVPEQVACVEEAVAVIYKNIVCCPAGCEQTVNVEAAIAALCAAADSGSGPIGLL